jgi:tetratricopeptide (TPR) repeat protein
LRPSGAALERTARRLTSFGRGLLWGGLAVGASASSGWAAPLSAWAPAAEARGLQDEGDVEFDRRRTQGPIELPVRLVGNRLVVRCSISGPRMRTPAHLFLAPDAPCRLELHNGIVRALGVERQDGSTSPIGLHFPGATLTVERREHGDQDALDEFTKIHAGDLGENACVGTLGAEFLDDWRVTYDLAAGRVQLEPLSEPGEAPPKAGNGSLLFSNGQVGGLNWLPVRLDDGTTRMLALGGGRFDSLVDEELCWDLGAYDGDVGPVRLGEWDLSEHIAWRPEPLDLVHPDGALGSLGLGFLEDFRVTVDAAGGWIEVRRVAEPEFPVADRAFFAARADEEPEELLAFLEEHGESRLAREAAELCVQWFVDLGAEIAELEPAIELYLETRYDDVRVTEAIDLVRLLLQSGRKDAAVVAGELGLRNTRRDRYPESGHRLRVQVGELLLEIGENRRAWEHLMSAAFGLTDAVGAPDRAKVDLLLGEYYEREGKYSRAMSRYVRAVTTPEAGEAAIERMRVLQPKMDEEAFSVDLVERLISGRIPALVAPDRFKPSAETDTGRCVLVEHFINPHLGRKQGEVWRAFTIGGVMGFQGIHTHYPRERVACLTYHIGYPQAVATMAECGIDKASAYGVGDQAIIVDGRMGSVGASRSYEADKVYNGAKSNVESALRTPAEHTIDGEAELVDGRVRGWIEVLGSEPGALELILAERGVLYPGIGEAVVHRYVARASLMGEGAGVPFAPQDGFQSYSFDADLEALEADHESFLKFYEFQNRTDATRLSARMDPQQLVLVAILRSNDGSGVLQSHFMTIDGTAAAELEEAGL